MGASHTYNLEICSRFGEHIGNSDTLIHIVRKGNVKSLDTYLHQRGPRQVYIRLQGKVEGENHEGKKSTENILQWSKLSKDVTIKATNLLSLSSTTC